MIEDEDYSEGDVIIDSGQDDANKALDLCTVPFGGGDGKFEKYTRWACENAKELIAEFAAQDTSKETR